jgi:hypothetical protein
MADRLIAKLWLGAGNGKPGNAGPIHLLGIESERFKLECPFGRGITKSLDANTKNLRRDHWFESEHFELSRPFEGPNKHHL